MKLEWMDDQQQMNTAAATIVSDLLAKKPDATIALPTGNTPLGLYRTLAALKQAGKFSCPEASFFNLDEFSGKSSDDPQSYGAFLRKHVFEPLAVDEGRIRLLRGDAPDLQAECMAFEAAIEGRGGLDLAILGLGQNGHIAFNEPGSDWGAGTRQVRLASTTRKAQAMIYASDDDVPTYGLTMGIPTIVSARAILLLVSGSGKQAALAALLRGVPDPERSVTALLSHSALTVLADKALRPGDHACSGWS